MKYGSYTISFVHSGSHINRFQKWRDGCCLHLLWDYGKSALSWFRNEIYPGMLKLGHWSWSGGSCCRHSQPTVINPDYNMTKQRYIIYIYDKTRSKLPPNRATSPTCLHCDVTHLSLTTGVVALHISSRRVGVREEHPQVRKIVWPVNAGRVICHYQNNLCGIFNHHKHIWECFCDV